SAPSWALGRMAAHPNIGLAALGSKRDRLLALQLLDQGGSEFLVGHTGQPQHGFDLHERDLTACVQRRAHRVGDQAAEELFVIAARSDSSASVMGWTAA